MNCCIGALTSKEAMILRVLCVWLLENFDEKIEDGMLKRMEGISVYLSDTLLAKLILEVRLPYGSYR